MSSEMLLPAAITVILMLTISRPSRAETQLYVATDGDDGWSGSLLEPDAGRTDGPLASLEGARDRMRLLREGGGGGERGPVTVVIRGGRYQLPRAFSLGPRDSGTADAPVTYAAYPGEQPVFSGGLHIDGWSEAQDGLWTAQVPDVAEGERYFRQLFVNGERRTRARIPNRGYLQLDQLINPFDRSDEVNRSGFRFHERDLSSDWRNLEDIEMVKMFSWSTTRLPVAEIDDEQNIIRFRGRTGPDPRLFDWAGGRYYVEHVFEGLDEPGEWYLDRPTGTLYYMPMPGETPETIEAYAPAVEHLVQFYGDEEAGESVHHITLRGLTFEHSTWPMPETGWPERQAQSAMESAAIHARFAEHCVLEDCEIRHVGAHGIWFERGCRHNRIERCHVWDAGAGGIYIGWKQVEPEASHNIVHNCFVHHLTEVHGGAIGVWIGQSSHNQITRNEIADMNYTGISVGWRWHYGPSLAHDNLIEGNYVHHCGHRVLSDMGGIYTLGESQGTVIRHNRFEQIYCYPDYSHASGIYLDQGSTDLLIEHNIVSGTTDSGFHVHYGKDSIVRNNVFAFAGKHGLSLSNPEEHRSFIFERNIVYLDHPSMAGRRVTEDEDLDRNLYWSTSAEPLSFCGMTLEEWREMGHDRNSIVTDPLFRDPASGDFTLVDDSPALELGFEPISTEEIGLYGDPDWVGLPDRFERQPDDPLPTEGPPLRINDDFDTRGNMPQPPGGHPLHASLHTEDRPELITISDEAAHSGRQSLRIEDVPDLEKDYNPHFYYRPNYTEGVARSAFALLIDEATVFYHEWRSHGHPYDVGPSLRVSDGEIAVDAGELLDLPIGEWIHIEVIAPLGADAGTWTLAVTLPDGTRHEFADLPCRDEQWRQLRWVGFVSNGTEPAVFYLDDVELELLAE
ncbi:MAG: right-handed parallel beta-helix repeat-containing protein [Armatimonadota bacterium]